MVIPGCIVYIVVILSILCNRCAANFVDVSQHNKPENKEHNLSEHHRSLNDVNQAINFRSEMTNLGITAKLQRHGMDPNKIQDLRSDLCKIYPVHVQRWEPSLKRYPVGVACKCDWVLIQNAFYGTTKDPKFVFVATRALPIFSDIMDSIPNPFVLITSINDETIPFNHDQRIGMPPGFTGRSDNGLWARIVNHPKVIHWFLENHSAVTSTKVSTLPIAFVSTTGVPEPDVVYPMMLKIADEAPKWHNRSTLLLSSDRVRDGHGQWHDRGVIRTMCIAHPLCTVSFTAHHDVEQDVKEKDPNLFTNHVSNAKFLIMAHGGGLDPCPKLVHSILLGTIPIIQSNALDDAYSQLPVVIIPSLEQFLHADNTQRAKELLDQWSETYAPYYELGSELRNQTLYRLSSDYWWKAVEKYGRSS